MQMSEQINELAAALSKAQGQMVAAKKLESVSFNKVSFKYADLNAVWDSIRQPLSDNELSVSQFPTEKDDGRVTCVTLLMHSSGQYISSELTIGNRGEDMKALGGKMTYARRYSLAIVGVVSDEDKDAEGLTPPQSNGQSAATPPATKNGKPIIPARIALSGRLREMQVEINTIEQDEIVLDEDWLATAPLEDLTAKGLAFKDSLDHHKALEAMTPVAPDTGEIPF